MNKQALKPCPFCGCVDIESGIEGAWCSACGVLLTTPEEWNIRQSLTLEEVLEVVRSKRIAHFDGTSKFSDYECQHEETLDQIKQVLIEKLGGEG